LTFGVFTSIFFLFDDVILIFSTSSLSIRPLAADRKTPGSPQFLMFIEVAGYPTSSLT